jgi:hypothetical protein
MTVDSLLNVLEVIAPFKHFNKLREFVQMKLPPGFPVKIGLSNTDLPFPSTPFRDEIESTATDLL